MKLKTKTSGVNEIYEKILWQCSVKYQGSDQVPRQLVCLDPETMSTPRNREILSVIINLNKMIPKFPTSSLIITAEIPP